MPKLLSINIGVPRDIEWNGKFVRTAIWKNPVSSRVMLGGSIWTAMLWRSVQDRNRRLRGDPTSRYLLSCRNANE
jgi:hypothetical protein